MVCYLFIYFTCVEIIIGMCLRMSGSGAPIRRLFVQPILGKTIGPAQREKRANHRAPSPFLTQSGKYFVG